MCQSRAESWNKDISAPLLCLKSTIVLQRCMQRPRCVKIFKILKKHCNILFDQLHSERKADIVIGNTIVVIFFFYDDRIEDTEDIRS
jgi:hypothetical protein